MHIEFQHFLYKKSFKTKEKITRPNLDKLSTINNDVYTIFSLDSTKGISPTIISRKYFIGNQTIE